MIHLNDLHFVPGSMKKKKRVARGNSGKSHGRGEKGQKARSGVSLSNFQGGQTPLERRVPKHNTIVSMKVKMEAISLSNIDELFENGLVKVGDVITRDLLQKFKFIKAKQKYKIIGSTEKSFAIEANAFSKGAILSIEAQKGSFKILNEEVLEG